MESVSNAAVDNNVISNVGTLTEDNNYEAAIFLKNSSPSSIDNNTLTNSNTGLRSIFDNPESSQPVSVTNNVITGNRVNVRVGADAQFVLSTNDLSDAITYAIVNDSSYGVDARNNYWGVDETAEIEGGTNPQALSFIYDSNNNANAGFVNYAGWLSSPDAAPSNLTIAGILSFQRDGVETTTYQVGDTVVVQYADADHNVDASVADTIDVLVTSDTENTGTPASASAAVAGVGNGGDGTVTVSGLGLNTVTETWTLTAISANSFLVSGSVSGSQGSTLSVGTLYTTEGGEASFLVEQGSVAFSLNDTFTLDTTAAVIVGETLTLTETGADTGVFSATVALSDSATAVASNSALELVPGDRIEVFYTDPQGDFGEALSLNTSALYVKTVVAGTTLSGDVIWETAGSPYLVTGDITIASGVTLTILPGVDVLFEANRDDQSSGNRVSDVEFVLAGGALVATGTEAAPITFASSSNAPAKGDWGGILYSGYNAMASSLSHVNVSDAGYGIDRDANGCNDFLSLSVTDSVFVRSGGVVAGSVLVEQTVSSR